MGRVLRVGLTGGIASGKSTVAGFFARQGAKVIDTDAIAREVVMPGAPALGRLVAEFGAQFLDERGELNRRLLRAHVFADAGARARLEAILHPAIEQETLRACESAGGPYQLIVVPLLLESGFDRHVDRVLVVDCPQAVQRQRLLARDAEDPEQAERILAAQLGREARLQRAHDVIDGGASLEDVARQVERLHQQYLAMASTPQARG